jgi:hypothetical protein
MSHENPDEGEGLEWLAGTYWYVPPENLLALEAVNTTEPVIKALKDQTVWHITRAEDGYLAGISATNLGQGWKYSLMVGSVAPDGAVKIAFPPLGAAGAGDIDTASMTIGDGSLLVDGDEVAFLMQMSSGSAQSSVSHWAYMLPVTPDDPEWSALPGYPETGIADLTELNTEIRVAV